MARIGSIALIVWLAACTESSSRAPVRCGDQTCGPDQLCATITAGRVCDGGNFEVLRVYCMDRPVRCEGAVSCDCVTGCALANGESRPCLMADDTSVSCGCF